jgi:hypothetical protein
MPTIVLFTPDEVMERGLRLVDKRSQESVCRSTQVSRFRDFFGSLPVVYSQLWEDLQMTNIEEARIVIGVPETDLTYFLLTINFLKKYPTENATSGLFAISEKTARDWKWYYSRKIQALMPQKIFWPNEWVAEGDIPVFLVSVDGIHCRTFEPTNHKWSKNPKYYSHKFKQAGLAYEVALSVFQNKVVSVNGPFPASVNDTTIFRDGIRDMIPEGKRAIVDNGYKGKDPKYSKPNSVDSPALRNFKGRARSRQECFNSRLKNFHCLSENFRHGEEKHKVCFEAIAVIGQYQLELGSPLFDV